MCCMFSIPKEHHENPFVLNMNHGSGMSYSVKYEPGESESKLFGGNSNWRGPIWLPSKSIITLSPLNF